jgi:multidrug efflux pump subunit AcrA (membrane-fusion protein)
VKVDFPSIQKSYNAEITRVGSYINPNNRTFEVEVDLTNTDDRLKPNLLAIMNIRDFEANNAVAIPSRLIQQDVNGNDYLFVITQNEEGTFVERRVIQTGLSYEDFTLVKSGLEVGEKIVDKGSRSINDGQQVTVKRSTEE